MLFNRDPDVIVYRNVGLLSLSALEMFAQIAEDALSERQRLLVALSGGSTPKRLFQLLSIPSYAQSFSWERIHFFWCDERLVPPDHAESNFSQAFELLFSHVKIPYENLHRIRGEAAPARAAEEYRYQLESFSEGNLKWPRFDLAFLGLGADGHTASLFPGAITLEERVSPVLAVTADYQGRPARRVTLTPLTLNSARNLIFMVSGQDKAHAVFETLNGSIDLEKWPAQRIQLVDGKIAWLLDDAAASR
ncbi:MAG: 6-phosphogluconolactonase [Anaerolineales bacterium]|jgi:6-phosphogluconolactonase